jgi:hypothetical protein
MSNAVKNFLFAGVTLAIGVLGPRFVQKTFYGAFAACAIFTGLGLRDLWLQRAAKKK